MSKNIKKPYSHAGDFLLNDQKGSEWKSFSLHCLRFTSQVLTPDTVLKDDLDNIEQIDREAATSDGCTEKELLSEGKRTRDADGTP